MLDISAITHSLKKCSFPRLQEVGCTIETTHKPQKEEAFQFVAAILAACQDADLVAVTISADTTFESPSYDPDAGNWEDFNVEILKGFFRYRHVRDFRMETYWLWAFTDAFVRDAAEAWPEIRTLYLDPYSWSGSRITLRGLTFLSLRCPLLRSFGAVMDAKQCQAFTGREPTSTQLQALFRGEDRRPWWRWTSGDPKSPHRPRSLTSWSSFSRHCGTSKHICPRRSGRTQTKTRIA